MMRRHFLFALVGLLGLLAACVPVDLSPSFIGDTEDPVGADYITIRYIKWGKEPVPSLLGGVAANTPEGFSAASEAQLQQIRKHSANYFGSYNGVKGMLFSKRMIDGYVAVLPMDNGSVRNADYNRYTFTDEQVADGIFLPVNDGLQGFYWGKVDGPYFYYLEFGMNVFKVSRCTQTSSPRIFRINGGILTVKN